VKATHLHTDVGGHAVVDSAEIAPQRDIAGLPLVANLRFGDLGNFAQQRED
jgi:hypothetical protein